LRFITKNRTLGLLASVNAGLIAWIVSENALLAIVVAVLGESVALVVDRHKEPEDLRRASGALNHPDLDALIANYAGVAKTGNPLLTALAEVRMIEAAEEMHQLAAGHAEVGPERLNLTEAQVLRSLSISGFATSLGHVDDFWLAELGGATEGAKDKAKQDYRRQIHETVRLREVPVTRLFLLESIEMALPAELIRLIDDELGAGIAVYVAYVDQTPPDLVEEFAIWDDKLVARVSWTTSAVTGPGGEKIVTRTAGRTSYHTAPAELLHARRQRADLMARAVPWMDARARHTR
jgi:hypothetical protein